ncbi:MAG: hypothetical protein H6909_04330 [Rickettsiaceae bacterium]|nr:hypothetical protein [Rickettsiaceae bacterium]
MLTLRLGTAVVLHIVAKKSQREIVKLLLKNNSVMDDNAIIAAVKNNITTI